MLPSQWKAAQQGASLTNTYYSWCAGGKCSSISNVYLWSSQVLHPLLHLNKAHKQYIQNTQLFCLIPPVYRDVCVFSLFSCIITLAAGLYVLFAAWKFMLLLFTDVFFSDMLFLKCMTVQKKKNIRSTYLHISPCSNSLKTLQVQKRYLLIWPKCTHLHRPVVGWKHTEFLWSEWCQPCSVYFVTTQSLPLSHLHNIDIHSVVLG